MAKPAEILITPNRPETKEDIENRAQKNEIKWTSKKPRFMLQSMGLNVGEWDQQILNKNTGMIQTFYRKVEERQIMLKQN